jgi:hypothetical protein
MDHWDAHGLAGVMREREGIYEIHQEMIASDAWLEDFKKSQNSPSGVLCLSNCITLPPQLGTFLQHTTFVGFVHTTLLPLPVPTQVAFLTCLKRMLRGNIFARRLSAVCGWRQLIRDLRLLFLDSCLRLLITPSTESRSRFGNKLPRFRLLSPI